MTAQQELFIDFLEIVGRRFLLTDDRDTLRFRRGFRSPAGTVLAVVRPGTLVEMWRLLVRLSREDVAIIIQAANTGLTGGSTPDDRIDRPVVIISTTRLSGIHLIHEARQVICLPGASLIDLEDKLAPHGREPHSVIGSTCFGASVVGGICNNSGGALVRRGPAYTELSLFARLNENGTLQLVNNLGVELGSSPEEMLERLETGDFVAEPSTLNASSSGYEARVRAIHEPTPARFNADPCGLYDASGSAGRIAVFAVRTDSFPLSTPGATFYIGTNDPRSLTQLRQAMLTSPDALPIVAEYIHRQAFDIAERYGRDIFYAIRLLGTKRLPVLYAAKTAVDSVGERIGIQALSDRVLHRLGRLMPQHLPRRVRDWRNRFEHHLILKIDAESAADARILIQKVFNGSSGAVFECTAIEAERAMMHRFVVASAAVRCQAIEHRHYSGLVSLDVALPRNAVNWVDASETEAAGAIAVSLVYGHFFCHVFHRDYLIAQGFDPVKVKSTLLASLDAVGAEYPAEHNVGRQYRAKPALETFYRTLDPTNTFNPGIGITTPGRGWVERTSSGEYT